MFDKGLVEPEAAISTWRERPLARLKSELLCLPLVVYPHDHNDDARKYATIAFIAAWGVIRATASVPLTQVTPLDLFVVLLVGRMWGIEIAGLQEFASKTASGSPEFGDSSHASGNDEKDDDDAQGREQERAGGET